MLQLGYFISLGININIWFQVVNTSSFYVDGWQVTQTLVVAAELVWHWNLRERVMTATSLSIASDKLQMRGRVMPAGSLSIALDKLQLMHICNLGYFKWLSKIFCYTIPSASVIKKYHLNIQFNKLIDVQLPHLFNIPTFITDFHLLTTKFKNQTGSSILLVNISSKLFLLL